jgi:alpha-tubulin suppressor-like RCC1 family protein
MSRASTGTVAAGIAATVVVALTACGEPTLPSSAVPTVDDPLAGSYVAISAGREHTCALTADGTAYCWGNNESLQLGVPRGETTCVRRLSDRQVACELRPTRVSGNVRFVHISAGGAHTCGLSDDRRIYCWGDNLHGQLGVPGLRESDTPTLIAVDGLFTDVAAGGEFTCAIRSDASIWCWGANDFGQLGLATIGFGSASPRPVATLARMARISAGERRTCGVSTSGTSYCWGQQWVTRDQFGHEVFRAQSRPQPVQETTSLQWISAGGTSTCGIESDNQAVCWEANPAGTIGDGSQQGSPVPIHVVTNQRFMRISAGDQHSCGVSTDGFPWCWGAATRGQLGVFTGDLDDRCGSVVCSRVPVRVEGRRVYSDISAGLADHTCALTISQNVYCWGAGELGQRGDGTRFDARLPVAVPPPVL